MHSPSISEGSFIIVDREQNQILTDNTLKDIVPNVKLEAVPEPEPSPALPTVGSFAHDWSSRGTGGKLAIHGRHFVDSSGRVCSLRGVNLAGNSKTPVNDDHNAFPANPEGVTFVGRPFPLEQAHEHFSRLRRWGFTFIRFLVTWEAVEHAGPGIYDTAYLEYLRALLSLLPRYGMTAFVSLHQDVWSRYSGGSGAPAWTLTSTGFDLDALEECGAAWLKGVKGGGHVEEERGLWPCGYQKLAAATMSTCFWAGDTFTPKLRVKNSKDEEVSIQTFLQEAFLDMWEALARAVGDLDGVLGFEIMNEPHRGYIDLQSMHKFDYNTDLHLGHVPTPFQSFQLGAGHPTSVGVWTRSFPLPTRLTSHEVLNPNGRTVWRVDGPTQGRCLWEMHGVWGWDLAKDEGIVLRENYFVRHPMTNKKIDWYTDFYYPFLNRWADRVRAASREDKIVFVEAIPNEFCPPSWTPEHRPKNMVYAPHWYDLNALFNKAFGDFSVNVQGLSRGMFPLRTFYWGHKGARENYTLQIRNIAEETYRAGETPVVIGECGIPMDMNKGQAFDTDKWHWQMRMMDALLTGLEQSLLGFTLWNYNPDNDDQRGDDWNGENFSWFSRRRAVVPSLLEYEQTAPTLDVGARLLRAVVRPYPAKTAGVPLRFEYEINSGEFTFDWVVPEADTKADSELKSNTIVRFSVGNPPRTVNGSKVVVDGLSSSDEYRYDQTLQTLYITAGGSTPGKVYSIRVSLAPRLRALFDLNDMWSDFGAHIATAGAMVLALIAYILTMFL